MTRTTRRSGRVTLGVLLALAVVSTAAAPGLITVRPGDTLWDLARTHGTTVSALRELNDLPGSGTIYAGKILRVSGNGGSGSSSSPGGGGGGGEVSHRVQSGDTLSAIALKYGTSVRAIQRRNGLSSTGIVIGRSLAVPGGSGSAAVASSSAGKRIPSTVSASVSQNRATLAARSHPSKAEVRQMVASTARKYGVSPSLAAAVAYHESGFQQRVVSPVNAIGVMQVLPRTGATLGKQYGLSLNLLSTDDNITAGVLLLRQLTRASGSTERVLAGYYQGAGSIARQGLLPQTYDYIRSINILRQRFADV